MNNAIPLGRCQCGCGGKTNTYAPNLHIKKELIGTHRLYLHGHNRPFLPLSGHPDWNGGVTIDSNGYRLLHIPDHPNASKKGWVKEHVFVAATVLGKAIPTGAEVHHSNTDRLNNKPSNLVICQDKGYHTLLHQRMAAFNACGHADYRKCYFCHEYDSLENLYSKPGRSSYHRDCYNVHNSRRARREKNEQ